MKRFTYSQLFVFASLVAFAIAVSLSACSGFFPGANSIVSLQISPLNQVVAPGATQQFTATATYGNNTVGDATTAVNWSSTNTNIATISSAGVATAQNLLGVTTISAKTGSVIAQTGLTVSNQTVSSVTVSPSSLSLIVGQTQQLTATAFYSNNSSGNVTNSASWSSSATGVATVNNAGVVTAVGSGTATITASFGGQSGNATVSVTGQ